MDSFICVSVQDIFNVFMLKSTHQTYVQPSLKSVSMYERINGAARIRSAICEIHLSTKYTTK